MSRMSQDTHNSAYEAMLFKRFHSFQVYFKTNLRGIIWLVNCLLMVTCLLVFTDPVSKLYLLDCIVKEKTFLFNVFFVLNKSRERSAVFI